MFSFAPPVKVARTQRLDGSTMDSFHRRETSGGNLARPTSLTDTMITSGGPDLTPSVFLSGVGEHMAWLVDENQKLVRLWNLADPVWRRTEPRIAPIPFFAAAEEGLPLFVSEMGETEQSLAFCSERGAVSSLDHSVEFQLLDGDDAVSASCFACVRRADCGDVIFAVIGTTSGSLAVDRKENGEHTTLKFDRLTFAEAAPQTTGRFAAWAGRRPAAGRRGSAQVNSRRSGSLWDSVRSFLTGGGNNDNINRTIADGVSRNGSKGAAGDDIRDSATLLAETTATATAFGEVNGDAIGPNGLAFTHALFRRNYPRELVAVNAASELLLLEMTDTALRPRWVCNVQMALGKAGYVVAVAENRHRISVLFLTTPTEDGAGNGSTWPPLPALLIATFSSSQGSLIHYVQISTIADVVKAVAEVPRHHIKLFVHDSQSYAIFFVRHYCMRVNIQVGVRSPCLSADTSVVEGLENPLCTLMHPNGSAVTLDVTGPVPTWENLWDTQPPTTLKPEVDRDSAGFLGKPLPGRDADVDKRIADILKAVKADGGRLTLDTAVLQASEDIYRQRRSHRGNWARADLNAEDENIVLYVTKDLRRRQQLHRRFLVSLLENEAILSELQPESVAQVVSAQEALLCQVALRSLQNVGLTAASSMGAPPSSLSAIASVARPFLFDDSRTSAGALSGGNRASSSSVKLVQSAEQVERCQQVLRRAIIAVANDVRSRAAATESHPIENATAVELVFSSPLHAVAVLRQVGEILLEKTRSAVVGSEEKFAFAYAAGCMLVIVAETIVESRENLKETYTLPPTVRRHLWTASENPVLGVQAAFVHMCTTLSSALVDAIQVPALQQTLRESENEETVRAASPPAFTNRVVNVAAQCELLDLIGYLLHFCFSNTGIVGAQSADGSGGGDPHVSALLKETLLREPLVAEPYGYPFGAPTPTLQTAEVSRRAVYMAEALAVHFDGVEVLLAFCLATPTEDPQPHQYAKLQAYCSQNSRMLSFALEALWRWRREWELLCLPSVLPSYAPTAATRDAFLERRAPHLLWLTAPELFDALVMEGAAAPPYIPYGPTQLSHRSRCLTIGKLAWIAGGAQISSKYDALALDASVVECQQRFLSPQCDSAVLGLQDLVQRLLTLDGNVPAWVGAAKVAAQANPSLAEDLLVQVMRRCKEYDGDALVRLYHDSVSELETMRTMRKTAVGEMVSTCAPLQDQATLARICETVLTAEERRIVSAWLAALWRGEN